MMRKSNQKRKVTGKLVAAAMAAAFTFMTASTVSAAEVSAAEQTSIADLQEIIGQDQPEGTPVVMDDGTVMYHTKDILGSINIEFEDGQDGISPQAENTYYRIDWTVKPDTRHVSPEYQVKKGQYICADVNVIPGNKTFKFGVMNDDGDAWHVVGEGTAYFNFLVPATNLYRVYVQNDYKDTKLYTSGGFSYGDRK